MNENNLSVMAQQPIKTAELTLDPDKSAKETKKLANKLNVPLRDITKYPMPNDEDLTKAGLFMYQLSLVGSCVDVNLQALVWNLYLKISNYIKNEGHKDPNQNLTDLMLAMDNIKEYIKISNNPIFKTVAENLK